MFSGASGSATLFGIEALALIEHADDQLARLGGRRQRELDGDQLAVVLAVAVLDGVDDRLAHGDADPVDRVLVQARELPDAIADHLDEIQHVEIAVNLEPDRAAAGQHAGSCAGADGAGRRRSRCEVSGLETHANG